MLKYYDKMGDGMLSLSWNNHKATFCHILSTLREKVSNLVLSYYCYVYGDTSEGYVVINENIRKFNTVADINNFLFFFFLINRRDIQMLL